MSLYTHRFGTALFTSNITFRSSIIENIIMDKRIELDKEKKIEASLLIYDYLIMQRTGLKLILEKKYDLLMNAIIYDKFQELSLQIKNFYWTLLPEETIGGEKLL